MKLREYMALCEPGTEITCWDKDVESEYYFYTKEVGEKSLNGKDFPYVDKCEKLLSEHLDIVKIHDNGVEVNLYELLENSKIIEFAKKNMFEEHQYEDDSDVVMMLFDDNVNNFANGYEGFSELMVQCLNEAFGVGLEKGVEDNKMVFHTTDSKLSKYNGSAVEIIRSLTSEECDIEDVGDMYKVKFYDGYIRDVFGDELSEVPTENREVGLAPKIKYGEMINFLNDNGILLMQPVIADCVDTLLPIGWDGSEEDYERLCEKCFDAYLEIGDDDRDQWDVVKEILEAEFNKDNSLDDVIKSCESMSKDVKRDMTDKGTIDKEER